MNSIFKKVRTLISDGVEPLEVGIANYLLNDPDIEALALKRYNLSKGYIEKEPIDFLRIKDERIEGLSEMMVSDCGCAAPYFFRQSIEKLKEWNE